MDLDWSILDGIQKLMKSDLMDTVMPIITSLGNAGIVWIIIGLTMTISKKYRKTGILVLIGLLMGLIIGNGIVKNIVARPRPCWLNSDFPLLIANPTDYSFPSGHTQASFIAATIITIRHHKTGWITMILAALIGFSRLYLYVHFPTDVLGGAVMGVLIALGTLYVSKIVCTKMKK